MFLSLDNCLLFSGVFVFNVVCYSREICFLFLDQLMYLHLFLTFGFDRSVVVRRRALATTPCVAVATLSVRPQIPDEFRSATSGEEVCSFWRKHGNSVAPWIKHVAQAILGVPASAAVLERDFSVAGQVISRKRGSLDPANVEMLLFLRGAYDFVPKEIPELSSEEVQKAIPDRLTDPDKLSEVEGLDESPPGDDRRGTDDEGSEGPEDVCDEDISDLGGFVGNGKERGPS